VYHEDKGFDDRRAVFLAPLPPSLATRRVLMTHQHAAKMTYLQGTPFRPLVRLSTHASSPLLLTSPRASDRSLCRPSTS
jgi:hypothetical protein